MYPVTLKLEGKPCVVVGGGRIAFIKLGPLLQAKANVTVVSPEISPEIEKIFLEGKIKIRLKEVEPIDYQEAFLIIAATNSAEINREIYEKVKDSKLVNVVTDSEIGNFHIPATFTRGKLQISIATGGASPMLAKKIRDELNERYDESYEEYLEFLYHARLKIKHSACSIEDKRGLLKQATEERYKDSIKEREKFLLMLE
ncbi:NAD(P)-binding protein [Anaerobacillus sp. CMMVII]|uniref:NAD(P)-binding protein n=1 Tax=Anaerobacillus sp. CMMVII TaxID=2755588 RepID=UPI0021B82F54|nr:NAD(P)-binding protein [Anaerobacillus sp. CMMVII]MCT8137626.1 NAD(P)-binding protein [Anaerobacillus sp. CMMVII]